MSTKQMYDQTGDKVSPLMEPDSLKVELVNNTTLHTLKINLYNKNGTLVTSFSLPVSGIVTNDMLANHAVTDVKIKDYGIPAWKLNSSAVIPDNVNDQYGLVKAISVDHYEGIYTSTIGDFHSLEELADYVIEMEENGNFVISAYAKMKEVTETEVEDQEGTNGYTYYAPIWFTKFEDVSVVSAVIKNISEDTQKVTGTIISSDFTDSCDVSYLENLLVQGDKTIIIFFYASQTNILE